MNGIAYPYGAYEHEEARGNWATALAEPVSLGLSEPGLLWHTP